MREFTFFRSPMFLNDILREHGIPLSLDMYDSLKASFTKRAKELGEDVYSLPSVDAKSWFEQEAKPIIERYNEAMYKRNPTTSHLVSLADILRERRLPMGLVRSTGEGTEQRGRVIYAIASTLRSAVLVRVRGQAHHRPI
jgi:hypothetical protein